MYRIVYNLYFVGEIFPDKVCKDNARFSSLDLCRMMAKEGLKALSKLAKRYSKSDVLEAIIFDESDKTCDRFEIKIERKK